MGVARRAYATHSLDIDSELTNATPDRKSVLGDIHQVGKSTSVVHTLFGRWMGPRRRYVYMSSPEFCCRVLMLKPTVVLPEPLALRQAVHRYQNAILRLR